MNPVPKEMHFMVTQLMMPNPVIQVMPWSALAKINPMSSNMGRVSVLNTPFDKEFLLLADKT